MKRNRPEHEERIVIEMSEQEKFDLLKKCEVNGWTIRYVVRKLLNNWLYEKKSK